MKVTVYHNVARDEHGRHINFDGYQPGQPLVPVFSYEVELLDGGIPELLLIAEEAFASFNADSEVLAGRKLELALRYRRAQSRSLSVGDVLRIDDSILACDHVGFRTIPGGGLNEVRVSEHGTHPIDDA
jgi:hypothetical protein